MSSEIFRMPCFIQGLETSMGKDGLGPVVRVLTLRVGSPPVESLDVHLDEDAADMVLRAFQNMAGPPVCTFVVYAGEIPAADSTLHKRLVKFCSEREALLHDMTEAQRTQERHTLNVLRRLVGR